MDRIRFAVVGLGVMGQRRIETIIQNKAAELVGVYDIDKSRSVRTSERSGCEYSTDLNDLLSRGDIDVVVVSVPNKFHSSISLAAMKAGKHVLCEKPMAITPVEAEEMVSAAEANGVYLKVGTNHRYFPNVLKAKETVESGKIGHPLVFRGWIGHDGSKFGAEWYKSYEIAGGGTLLDNGCHILDISRMMLGDVKSCIAEVDNLIRHDIRPAEDYASVIYRTANNGMISINCSWIEWYGYLYFEVYGDEGFMIIDARYGNRILTGKRGTDSVEIVDYTNRPQQSFKLELEHLIDSLRRGVQPDATGFDGMRVIQMIHAAYESSSLGRRVTL